MKVCLEGTKRDTAVIAYEKGVHALAAPCLDLTVGARNGTEGYSRNLAAIGKMSNGGLNLRVQRVPGNAERLR